MRDSACIRHALLTATGDEAARLRRDLAIATRRENKRLVRRLRYKADIYGPFGRIYSFEHKLGVSPTGELPLDGVPVDPYTLRDGNGRIITCER